MYKDYVLESSIPTSNNFLNSPLKLVDLSRHFPGSGRVAALRARKGEEEVGALLLCCGVHPWKPGLQKMMGDDVPCVAPEALRCLKQPTLHQILVFHILFLQHLPSWAPANYSSKTNMVPQLNEEKRPAG